MRRVTAADLEEWARRDARAPNLLPELVRRLIHSTAPKAHGWMPAGKEVSRRGYDGRYVLLEDGTAFVPSGASVWEMGCDADVERKANGDYQSRTSRPLEGVMPSETTFIFVTPRRWTGFPRWVEDHKRASTIWHDLRVYDAAVLEEWLELSPSASAWMGAVLGRPSDALDLETFWDAWSRRTQPPTSLALVLGGREPAMRAMTNWLRGAPSAMSVGLEDPEEAAAFLYAVGRQFPDVERDRLTDRVVVVRTDDVLRRVVLEGCDLIVVAVGCDIGEARSAAARGHHVLVATRGQVRGERLDLGPLDRPRACAALEVMGLSRERAESYAQKSLLDVRRLLGLPESLLAPVLAPLLLAGSWDEEREADWIELLRLTELARPELESLLRSNTVGPDALLEREGSTWRWRTRLDAWRRGAHALTRTDLERFISVALNVLGEVDPRYELPEEERWAAVVRGKVLQHSEVLRGGVAEGIVFLAVEGGALPAVLDGIRTSEELVYRALQGATTWQAWATLDLLLPTLAEAAPRTFLRGVRRLIEGNADVTAALFPADEGGSRQAGHGTGLIRALEILAWHPDHLWEVADLLLFLAEQRWSRALGVLRTFFLHWLPRTTATVDRRIEVLRASLRRHPEVGFDLLVRLLPQMHHNSGNTACPKYRLWLEGWDERASGADAHRLLIATWEMVVEGADARPDRLMMLLPHLHRLSVGVHRPRIFQALEHLDVTQIDEVTRRRLWAAVRDVLHDNLSFKDADCALNDEAQLQILRRLYERLKPEDLLERYAWLFAPGAKLPWVGRRDRQAYDQSWTEARRKAVRHLVSERGPRGLLDLAASVAEPGFIGHMLGRFETVSLLRSVLSLLPDDPGLCPPTFRPALASGYWQRDDEAGLAALGIEGLAPLVRADLALGMPFQGETWDQVERWGQQAEEHYWRNVSLGWMPERARDLHRALKGLIDIGRARDAFFLASRDAYPHRDEQPVLSPEDIVLVLEAVRSEAVDGHEVGDLLKLLAKAGAAWDGKRFELEWAYFAALEFGDYKPQLLYRYLAEQPKLFVEVLSMVFRADGEAPREGTPEEITLGTNAYRLLRLWDLLPGQSADGAMDTRRLHLWVEESRRLASQRGRAAVADSQIGQVLARAPVGQDGIWPHEAVRDVMEGLRNTEHIETGLVVGHTNGRGAGFRAFGKGGASERSEADRFRGQAATLRGRWPTTARLLDTIADDLDRVAKTWDAWDARIRDAHRTTASTTDRLAVWVDQLQMDGRYTLSLSEAASLIGETEPETEQAAKALVVAGCLAQPEKGFYVIVPIEYRTALAPPPTWYIHDWMTWARQPYCVGLLTAASLYGATPQQPQEFQVLVDRPRESVTVGRARFRWVVSDIPGHIREMKTDTGIMHVSAPEGTALDLVEHAHEVGGIDAIANILVELGESLEPERLAEAAQRYPSAVVQRLGWLLERVEWQEVAMALKQVVLEKANGLVWLRSDAAVDDTTPEIVRDWRVAVERDVELDG